MQGAEGIGLHKLLWGFFRKGSCEGSIWEFPKIGDPNIVPEIVGNPKIRYPYFRKLPYGCEKDSIWVLSLWLLRSFRAQGLGVWVRAFGRAKGFLARIPCAASDFLDALGLETDVPGFGD